MLNKIYENTKNNVYIKIYVFRHWVIGSTRQYLWEWKQEKGLYHHLCFLAEAEARGGIHAKHRDFTNQSLERLEYLE